MCFKNWFTKPVPVVWPRSAKVALLFAINNYPGGDNDLNGCLNDQANVASKLPDFQIRAFKDSEVTVARFLDEIKRALFAAVENDVILIHYSGHGTYVTDMHGDEADGYDEALYLYDRSLVDDEFGAVLDHVPKGVTVVILLDSCFSGGSTRFTVLDADKQSKFVRTSEDSRPGKKLSSFAREGAIKWIVFSGCSERQTSADAFINGAFRGAFTFYAMRALQYSDTYSQWFDKIKSFLPSAEFEQIPTLEGPAELLNKRVLT